MGLVIVTTQGTTMTVIITKLILSIFLTITVAAVAILLVYWLLTILTVVSSLLGLHRVSKFFRNFSVSFSSALERAYKSIRYR